MGANCIYPLIGHSDYRWQFLGSDIDATAIAAARAIVQANGLNKAIQIRQQGNRKHILLGLLEATERFELTMCNPPFHASSKKPLGAVPANGARWARLIRNASCRC